MTAIPEPTREDFENLQKLEAWHSACAVRMSGKVVADSWQESLGSAVRLLSHYQRENERMARDAKRIDKLESVSETVYFDDEDSPGNIIGFYKMTPRICFGGANSMHDGTLREKIDAFQGEGGGA